MTQEHPVIPSLELLKYWEEQHFDEGENYDFMLIQAYQNGADRELEECRKWISVHTTWDANRLYAARRPKPPSLKEQALILLDDASDRLDAVHENTIRRALESLPD